MLQRKEIMKKKILFLLVIASIFSFAFHTKALELKIKEKDIQQTIIQKGEEVLHLKYYQSEKDDIIYNYYSNSLSIPSYEELSYFTQWGNFILNLPVEQWNWVELLAYYGYGYQSHTELKWYEITQYLIWNILEPNSTWSITDPTNPENHYELEIEELKNLVRRHLTLPSFANDFIVIKEGEETFLKDENDVFRDYQINSVGNIALQMKEEGILVSEEVHKFFPSEENIIFLSKYGVTGHYTKIYLNPRYKLIGRGDFTDIDLQVPVYIGGGSIILNEGNPDVRYVIENENGKKIDFIKVGEPSRLLPYGKYFIKADFLPPNVIDDQIYEIQLNKENTKISLDVIQKEEILVEKPEEEILPENPKVDNEIIIEKNPWKNESMLEKDPIKETDNIPVLPSFSGESSFKNEEQVMLPSTVENIKKPIVAPPQVVQYPSSTETKEEKEAELIVEDTFMKEVLDQQPIEESKTVEKNQNYFFLILYSILVISIFFLAFIFKNHRVKK